MYFQPRGAVCWVIRFAGLFAAVSSQCVAAEPWVRVASANFELYTIAGEKKGREAVLYFEQLRSFFGRIMKVPGRDATPVRIVAFRSEKEYTPYAFNEVAAAYYARFEDRDYIVLKAISAEYFPVAAHEFMHRMIEHTGARLPVWLNEGLADYFSTLKPVGNKVQVGWADRGRMHQLDSGEILDLATLTSVNHSSSLYNEKKRAGLFYAQSWALTHMIQLSPEYRGKAAEFLRVSSTGAASSEVFSKVYGKSLAQVAKDLGMYVRDGLAYIVTYDTKLEKAAEAPEVRTASPLETGVALAELLLVVRKQDDARAASEELAKQFPKSWEVEVLRARIAYKSGDHYGVQKHFARAVELGTTNPKVYVDYAMAMRSAGDIDDQKAAELLRRAVELDPDFKEARYLLGFLALNAGQYEDAVTHLVRVKRLEPHQAFPFFRALAYASYRAGKKDEAKKAAERAREHAETPNQNRDAEDLLALVTRPGTPVEASVLPAPRTGAPGPAPDQERRLLARRSASPPRLRVTGTLEHVDCAGVAAKFRISGGDRRMVLLAEDASKVVMKNSGGRDFACGPQKPAAVVMEYDSAEGLAEGILGVVRSIEFQ